MTEEEMGVTGWFRRLCHKTVTETIDEILEKEHSKDYQTSRQRCEFVKNKIGECQVSPAESRIKFNMHINTDSDLQTLRDDHSEDTIKFVSELQRKLKEAISAQKRPVNVIFEYYEYNCFIIEGVVELHHGTFSPEEAKEVVEIILSEVRKTLVQQEWSGFQINQLHDDNVNIKTIPAHLITQTMNCSDISFSMTISTSEGNFEQDVLRELSKIEKSIALNIASATRSKKGKCDLLALLLVKFCL